MDATTRTISGGGDGKLTPTQCRKIYNAIKDFHIDMAWYRGGIGEVNFLDEWKKSMPRWQTWKIAKTDILANSIEEASGLAVAIARGQKGGKNEQV